MGALTLGADWLFGYAGDIDAAYTGISVVTWSTGRVGMMFGLDDCIYFGDGTNNILTNDTWRMRPDGAGIGLEQYDSGGSSWEKHIRVSDGGVEVNSDEAFYLGDPGTDGTWRIIRDGNNLVHQRRESGVWVTKHTITP